jgi:hypothetical protein
MFYCLILKINLLTSSTTFSAVSWSINTLAVLVALFTLLSCIIENLAVLDLDDLNYCMGGRGGGGGGGGAR